MTAGRSGTGQLGESAAASYLEAKGYVLLERNWHCRAGEIDVIMLDGDVLVFAEVKTRRSNAAGSAEESVSGRKAARLLSAGEWFVAEHPEHEHRLWRIDIVAITMGSGREPYRVTHLENAVTTG